LVFTSTLNIWSFQAHNILYSCFAT